MESLQSLKQRLKGVQNIGKITKAMELVAATKMRKSQEIALRSRAYAFAAMEFLSALSRLRDIQLPALFQKRPVEKTLYLLIASDKGLAGSFNAALIRRFELFMKEERINPKSAENLFAAVGQKAYQYFDRKGIKTEKTFLRFGDYTSVEETGPLSEFLCRGFIGGNFDRTIVFSMNFRSALKQEVLMRQILPVDFEILKKVANELIPETGRFSEWKKTETFFSESLSEYLIEPEPQTVLEKLAPHLVEMQIYHLVLEANASEHSARRLAMKSASDNADELSAGLNLQYNKSRQASITRELIEITTSAEALK